MCCWPLEPLGPRQPPPSGGACRCLELFVAQSSSCCGWRAAKDAVSYQGVEFDRQDQHPLSLPCSAALPAGAAAPRTMAGDDLPVLPSNFFNDPSLTGHWNFQNDFQDVMEIGKGKVRRLRGGAAHGLPLLTAVEAAQYSPGKPISLLPAA